MRSFGILMATRMPRLTQVAQKMTPKPPKTGAIEASGERSEKRSVSTSAGRSPAAVSPTRSSVTSVRRDCDLLMAETRASTASPSTLSPLSTLALAAALRRCQSTPETIAAAATKTPTPMPAPALGPGPSLPLAMAFGGIGDGVAVIDGVGVGEGDGGGT